MLTTQPTWLIALAGFLLGSLPFSVWIGRGAGGIDVRKRGTRNPGATNVWRSVGRASGALAAALDAAKGAAAVWIAWRAGLRNEQAVWIGAAAVVGHDFSPFLRFKGGKGGATTLGVLACFILPELIAVLAVWLIGWILFPRRRFLWSIVSLSTAPAFAFLTGRFALPYLGEHPARPDAIILAAFLLVILLWIRVAPGLMRRSVGHA